MNFRTAVLHCLLYLMCSIIPISSKRSWQLQLKDSQLKSLLSNETALENFHQKEYDSDCSQSNHRSQSSSHRLQCLLPLFYRISIKYVFFKGPRSEQEEINTVQSKNVQPVNHLRNCSINFNLLSLTKMMEYMKEHNIRANKYYKQYELINCQLESDSYSYQYQ